MRYALKRDAEAGMHDVDVRPGTLVTWDKGTSSLDPVRPRDWPGLVIKIEVVDIDTNAARWYEVRVTTITPERRIRRYNARFVRRRR